MLYSRLVQAMLMTDVEQVDLEPYHKDLKVSFIKFYGNVNLETDTPPKLMQFQENNFNLIANRLKDGYQKMKDSELWNTMI